MPLDSGPSNSSPSLNPIASLDQNQEVKEWDKDTFKNWKHGEIISHWLPYNAFKFKEGDEVSDRSDGPCRIYSVTDTAPGLKASILVPEEKHPNPKLTILFCGTKCFASFLRDITEGKAAGHLSFKASLDAILNQLIEKLEIAQARFNRDIPVEIAGHSLGAADAQHMLVALLKMIIAAKRNKLPQLAAYAKITTLSMFCANAPGVTKETINEAKSLEPLLKQHDINLTLDWLHADHDPVQLTAEGHIFSDAERTNGVTINLAKMFPEESNFYWPFSLLDLANKAHRTHFFATEGNRKNPELWSNIDARQAAEIHKKLSKFAPIPLLASWAQAFLAYWCPPVTQLKDNDEAYELIDEVNEETEVVSSVRVTLYQLLRESIKSPTPSVKTASEIVEVKPANIVNADDKAMESKANSAAAILSELALNTPINEKANSKQLDNLATAALREETAILLLASMRKKSEEEKVKLDQEKGNSTQRSSTPAALTPHSTLAEEEPALNTNGLAQDSSLDTSSFTVSSAVVSGFSSVITESNIQQSNGVDTKHVNTTEKLASSESAKSEKKSSGIKSDTSRIEKITNSSRETQRRITEKVKVAETRKHTRPYMESEKKSLRTRSDIFKTDRITKSSLETRHFTPLPNSLRDKIIAELDNYIFSRCTRESNLEKFIPNWTTYFFRSHALTQKKVNFFLLFKKDLQSREISSLEHLYKEISSYENLNRTAETAHRKFSGGDVLRCLNKIKSLIGSPDSSFGRAALFKLTI